MRLLKTGSVGPSVQLLQLALNRAGFGSLETDGIFGNATKYALMRFQSDNALDRDGIAGPVTHRALLPYYTGSLTHVIRPGDTCYALARRYGTTVTAIETANPAMLPESLRPGERAVIPLGFDVVPTTVSFCSDLVAYCCEGLSRRYPFIRLGQIGKSVMGRPLWMLTLGSGLNRVMYSASHHANEWITTPILLKFTEQLARAYVSGGELASYSAAEIMDYATLCIVPAVDPDGMDLVTGELSDGPFYSQAREIAAGYPRFDFPRGWKANIQGVDLNLQYPSGWEQAKINKYAQGIISPAPADFVGKAPLSAPESRALYDYTLSFSPDLVLAYHTQGQVIYWRYSDYEPPNSRPIAEAFSYSSGYTVEETPFASAFAGYKDWFIESFDRPGYTIEAGKGTNPLPITEFDRIYEQNLGILALGALVT